MTKPLTVASFDGCSFWAQVGFALSLLPVLALLLVWLLLSELVGEYV